MTDLGNPLGRHQWDIPASQITDGFVRATFEGILLQYLAVLFIKISILVFYLRLFKPILWARIAIWTGLAALLGFYITINIVLLAICIPRHGKTWREVSSKQDWQTALIRTSLAAGWFGTLADLYILAIPIRLLSTLNLSRKHKFGVMAIFLTGLMWVQAPHSNLLMDLSLTNVKPCAQCMRVLRCWCGATIQADSS